MVHGEDPTALQAWLVAIPSAITALSTWYINRKTKKTIGKTEENLTAKSDGHHDDIAELKARVALLQQTVTRLDATVDKIQSCQIMLAQKYTESMNALQTELAGQRRAFERSNPVNTGPGTAEESSPEPKKPEVESDIELETDPPTAKSGVKLIDVPAQPVGKVTWKK